MNRARVLGSTNVALVIAVLLAGRDEPRGNSQEILDSSKPDSNPSKSSNR